MNKKEIAQEIKRELEFKSYMSNDNKYKQYIASIIDRLNKIINTDIAIQDIVAVKAGYTNTYYRNKKDLIDYLTARNYYNIKNLPNDQLLNLIINHALS